MRMPWRAALFTALVLAMQWAGGAYRADLGVTSDEASHFVNSLMIADYLRHGLGHDPMAFALDYYRHFPRVSIGHWPPLFHLVQALAMLVFGGSLATALGLQAVIAGTLGAVVAGEVERRQGPWVGLAAAAVVLASPNLLYLADTVMLDNFLALLVLLATLAWDRYAATGRPRWSAAFGLCAAAAIMTKGNGLGLALLPPLHALLARRPDLLRSWRSWLAAAIVAVPTVPWYVLTYRMAAAGFVYHWGWDYTSAATPAYLAALPHVLGGLALAGLLVGAVVIVARVADEPRLVAPLATVLAMILFELVAPADIQPRYLIPALPPALIVAAFGLGRMARWAGRPAATLAVLLLVADAAAIWHLPRIESLGMDQAAAGILGPGDANPLVLVGSSAPGEGALIAAFAAAPGGHGHYVLRASKALATSNFMGTDYTARFHSDDEVARWLAERRIGWLVVDTKPDAQAMAHNRQLKRLAEQGGRGWRLVRELRQPEGRILVYRLGTAATPPEVEGAMRENIPDKIVGRY